MTTIEFTPAEYKIKYFPGQGEGLWRVRWITT